jgi:hypothetical protein
MPVLRLSRSSTGQPQVRAALQERENGDLRLHVGQVDAGAEVRAVAEGEVRLGCAGQVEPLRGSIAPPQAPAPAAVAASTMAW